MNISQYRTLISIDVRKTCFTLLILMYAFGTVGLLLPVTQPYFKLMSSLNLWLSLILLLYFHQNFNKSFIYTSLIIFMGGFLVEVLGVSTGLIFGNYWYGSTLGIKLFGVPLVIGANWLLLVYCSSITTQKLLSLVLKKIPIRNKNIPVWFNAFCAALAMVMLDFLIEPVAIRLDFWHWQNEQIPTQNFQAWFLIAFVFNYIFLKAKFLKVNSLAILLLALQFFFFISLTIFYHFI